MDIDVSEITENSERFDVVLLGLVIGTAEGFDDDGLELMQYYKFEPAAGFEMEECDVLAVKVTEGIVERFVNGQGGETGVAVENVPLRYLLNELHYFIHKADEEEEDFIGDDDTEEGEDNADELLFRAELRAELEKLTDEQLHEIADDLAVDRGDLNRTTMINDIIEEDEFDNIEDFRDYMEEMEV